MVMWSKDLTDVITHSEMRRMQDLGHALHTQQRLKEEVIKACKEIPESKELELARLQLVTWLSALPILRGLRESLNLHGGHLLQYIITVLNNIKHENSDLATKKDWEEWIREL